VQLCLGEQRMLFKFLPHQRQRELRAVNRHVQITKNVGDRANMIFMRVRQDDGSHHAPVLFQVGNVRDDDIDAQQLLLGKHQSRIDHDDVLATAEGHHVHAELAQPAQRNSPQRRSAQFFFPSFSLSFSNGWSAA